MIIYEILKNVNRKDRFMKILNFGSLNIDLIYSVPHIAAPGETVSSSDLKIACGGKGFNQSIALSRAGAAVCHAGMIGGDGGMLTDFCRRNGIGTSYIRTSQTRTGTATIQVSADGQNSILLYGGANLEMDDEFIGEVLNGFSEGDMILLQNEINLLESIAARAYGKGMEVVLNPAPFNDNITSALLDKVSLLILNEIEGAQLAKTAEPSEIIDRLTARYPKTRILLTLGDKGAMYQDGGTLYTHGIYKTDVIDTTAAGDTFIGYFLGCSARGYGAEESLRIASKAAAITVSRPGAAASVPTWDEVAASPVCLADQI
jgi:ribokinase